MRGGVGMTGMLLIEIVGFALRIHLTLHASFFDLDVLFSGGLWQVTFA